MKVIQIQKIIAFNIEYKHISVLFNEIEKNKELFHSCYKDSDGTRTKSEYVFKQPTKVFFEMRTPESKTQLVYQNTMRILFVKHMDVFTECNVTLTDKPTHVKFYVLDDKNNLTFKIGEDNEKSTGRNNRLVEYINTI